MPTPALTEWDEDFERFVEFGTLLDRKTRRYLVRYLLHKLGEAHPPHPIELDTYQRYFTRALDRIFGGKLLEMLKRQKLLGKQISKEYLKWMRQIHIKMQEDDPFGPEKRRIEQWASTPQDQFIDRWATLQDYLSTKYTKQDLDVTFYQEKLDKLVRNRPLAMLSKEEQQELELVFTDLLSQWDAIVQARSLEHEMQNFEEQLDDFQSELEGRIDEHQELTSLLGPFAEYIGRSWDMSRKLWERTSFNVLEKYKELLKDEDSVRILADLLGQMREAEIELEEESFEKVIVNKKWIDDPMIREEIDGIEESNNLNALLSSEASLLGDPLTETVFLRKFSEQRLMTFKYQSRRLVTSKEHELETYQKVKQKEKGPFIICVDTSDSMRGLPEHIAKVLCFAILKMAAEDDRRAFLINFSTQVETIDLYDLSRSLDAIANFLQMSFHAGTSISMALYEVLRQLDTESYKDADVLVISDFIMYRVEQDIVERMRHHQINQGTQFHCLTLSSTPVEQFMGLFDSNWIYDPEQKGVIRELSNDMRTIRGREVY
ncbi:MAG TPA: hypothetical protein DCE42_23100 [Myxococcales bacterium]|nr:hypothetical protein [Deltaproteobacteria bacterium]HAA57674.1 hypothetical protein [Myxococcales bacterium]|tara:strand:+ start:18098 stop:19735 length:1638 start_codon:yes stop_codon:yes gene_type:complete